jgi:hypothetical protein
MTLPVRPASHRAICKWSFSAQIGMQHNNSFKADGFAAA